MFKFLTTNLLVICFLNINPAMARQQTLVSTFEVVESVEVQQKRKDFRELVTSSEVQEKLAEMGVPLSDLENRIEGLTAYEVTQLHQEINQARAGGILVAVLLI